MSPIALLRAAAVAVVVAGTAASALAMGMGGDDSSASSAPPPKSDYERAVGAVEDERYREAIALLQQVVHEDPSNADAYNYLGFSHRKLGEYDPARTYYQRALDIDPDHVGALEYLGELHVETGDVPAAEQALARIASVCGMSCEEYQELKARIEAARRS